MDDQRLAPRELDPHGDASAAEADVNADTPPPGDKTSANAGDVSGNETKDSEAEDPSVMSGGRPEEERTRTDDAKPSLQRRLVAFFANREIKLRFVVIIGLAILASIAAGGATIVVERVRAKPPAANLDLGGELVYFELPTVVANLRSTERRPRHIKLSIIVEVRQAHVDAITAKEMAISDAIRGLLLETSRDELAGKVGSEWLRGNVLAIVNRLAAPATAENILFKELLID